MTNARRTTLKISLSSVVHYGNLDGRVYTMRFESRRVSVSGTQRAWAQERLVAHMEGNIDRYCSQCLPDVFVHSLGLQDGLGLQACYASVVFKTHIVILRCCAGKLIHRLHTVYGPKFDHITSQVNLVD